jgi:exonuclease III
VIDLIDLYLLSAFPSAGALWRLHGTFAFKSSRKPFAEAQNNNMLDVLMIQESKLDESFPVAQFALNGYNLYRYDHTEHSGGIMVYIRNDLPHRERSDLEIDSQEIQSGRVESVVVEMITDHNYNGIKWFLCNVYKQPTVTNIHFKTCMENILTKCTAESINFVSFG